MLTRKAQAVQPTGNPSPTTKAHPSYPQPMPINTYHQDGYLLWTSLHRAARLNDVTTATRLLQQGADPNLKVRLVTNPVIDSHGAHDEWLQSGCYYGKTCLDLARNIFGRDCDRSEMRQLLRAHDAKPSHHLKSNLS